MYHTEERALRTAVRRARGLLAEAVTGGLIGALGGGLCGVLFGAFCWAAFGQVSLVWASGAVFLRAFAAAGVVATISTQWSDPEPLGWRDLIPRPATEPPRRSGRLG